MIHRIFSVMLILLFTVSLSGADKMRIAVMDFNAEGVSKAMARKISELIRNDMINSKNFTVIERSGMTELLKELSFQQSGFTDDKSAVKAGKMLSADKILAGTVMKIGNSIIITGRIVDVERATSEFSHKETVSVNGDIVTAAGMFAKNLVARIEGKSIIVAPEKPKDPAYSQNITKPTYTIPKDAPPQASVNGKYYNLLQILNCPRDARSYGKYYDWGYWRGKRWCGQSVQPGYWVWYEPNWYIWKQKR